MKTILLSIVLWNTCVVFGEKHFMRNGRHPEDNKVSAHYIPGSRVYFDDDDDSNSFKPGILNYNDDKAKHSGNVNLNSPQPMLRFHVETERDNSPFNFGIWKVLNDNSRESSFQKKVKDPSERKDKLRISSSLPTNANRHQSVDDEISSLELQSDDLDDKQATKLGSCACYWKQEKCGCDCEGTLNYDDFQNISKSLFSCHNFTFTMANGEYYALPPNFFSRIKNVQDFNLFITNSTFEYICDPTPLTSPFKGIIFDDSARIKLSDVKVRRGWNWKPFEQLKSSSGAQVKVTLENCQLRRLTSDFANLAGGQVDTIDINNSEMQMIGSNAFKTFENMTRFRIPNNKLQQLRRTDFPQLLYKLEELDLRNNDLRYLDNDLFTNMPSLKEIVLSGNPISVLPEATFQAVISKTELVGISDIPLTCDCRLQWLKESMKSDNRTEKNMKGAVCRRPPYLRGMPLDYLSKEHLICP